MMRRSAGLFVLTIVLAACGGAVKPITSTAPVAPDSTVATGCMGGDFQAHSVLFRAAEEGEIPADVPSQLGLALEKVPPALLGGLLYAGCSAEQVDDLTHELMAWTNGIGLLLIAWQEWPGDGDLGPLPLGGEIRQAGIVQVSTVDQLVDEEARTRIIHLFDGMRVVTVASYSLTTLPTDKLEEIAWTIYDAIPVDTSNRTGIGVTRSLDELLAALASDLLTVEDPEDVPDLSPFTATLGIVNATYRFTAAGNVITVFDFGGIGAADRAAATVSSDGYTIAHTPYEVSATPRFWRWDRLIIRFMGDNDLMLARLDEVIGPAFAGDGIGD